MLTAESKIRIYPEEYVAAIDRLWPQYGSGMLHNFKYIKQLWLQNPRKTRLTLTDVVVHPRGFIVDYDTCTAFLNSDCPTPELAPALSPSQIADLPRYRTVLSLDSRWAKKVAHFPLDNLLSLAYASDGDLDPNKTILHISDQSMTLTLEWLALLRLDDFKVVDGSVFAETLIVPRMDGCLNPYVAQLEWLKDRIGSVLDSNSDGVSAEMHWTLVRRRVSRAISPWSPIEETVRHIAYNDGSTVVLHDESDLPSLRDQVHRFQNTKILIGPHGAAHIFMFAMRPGTCVIEITDVSYPNGVFARLSYLLGLNYVGVVSHHWQVNLGELETAILHCLEGF